MLRALLGVFAVAALAAGVEKLGTNQHLWQNTELTTQLWRLCSQGDVQQLAALLDDQPNAVNARSEDGRGPLWWAIEHKQQAVMELLVERGANPEEKDADGKKPEELKGGPGLTEWAQKILEEKRREVEEMNAEDDLDYDDY